MPKNSPYDTDCPQCHSMNFELVDENVYDETRWGTTSPPTLWFKYECKLCAARWEAPLALDPSGDEDDGPEESYG